jgi:acyl-CoA reductase-like NAD-dependent aldehyde dehydrogenase
MSKQPATTETRPIRARIGGAWRDAEQIEDDVDPYRGNVVAQAPISSSRDCNDAIAAANEAKKVMARMPAYERATLLRRAADLVSARADDIGRANAMESGKALREAQIEARRSADLLRLHAEEAIRIQGEHIPMDGSPAGAGKIGMLMRFPVGVVVGITPFNAPVSSAAHKLGPALAAGNSVILKPSPKAPLCVHKFVEAIIDAGVPDGAVNSLFGDAIASQRVDFVTFTGSIRVGKIIHSTVGLKRVVLELGGVGPTFVHGDADLAAAATACARNAMLLAGQSCVSVQNVFVEKRVFEPFLEMVCREIDALRFGDPLDPTTEVGTLIDEAAATRVEAMIGRAVDAGAKLLRGCRRKGAQLDATLLADVTSDMEVVREEIFGPAMTIQPYEAIEPVFQAISDSRYGLQCGIFTNSLDLAVKAIKSVRTGGVIVNGTSRWRSDQMPYGGVKDSGIGREGAKSSVHDMTEERFFVFN